MTCINYNAAQTLQEIKIKRVFSVYVCRITYQMSIRKDSQQVLTHPRIWKAQYIYSKLQKTNPRESFFGYLTNCRLK